MLSIFHPVAVGLGWLGVLAVAATLAVAVLVLIADRQHSRRRAIVALLPLRLRKAA